MKPGVRKLWGWGTLTAVAAVVAGYLGGLPVAVFVAMVGFAAYKLARPDSGPKYRGGTGFDDYNGGHDGGHGGDHGGGGD